MYWPIGAPKVYALSKHATTGPNVSQSHDGTDTAFSSEAEGDRGRDGVSSRLDVPADTNASVNGQGESNIDRGRAVENEVLATQISRGGTIFATITRSSLTIWQAKPAIALAAVVRSPKSLKAYGPSTELLMRPDGLIIVVQTELGFLITYTLSTDLQALVYQTQLPASSRHGRKDSVDGYTNYKRPSASNPIAAPGEQYGIREVNLRFRMVIRIDAGISKAVALDDELIVATRKPAAVQCIRWIAESGSSQTSTELLSRMPWLRGRPIVVEMVHDRPMNLSCWLTDDGSAYAVQRVPLGSADIEGKLNSFQGFCFREAETEDNAAIKLAINARFSLIAVACVNGNIDVYTVKDYTGNIPLSHKLRVPASTSEPGMPTLLSYSPDGYSLFAGFEKGWAIWSVYGKPTAYSFGNDQNVSRANDEKWLSSVRDAFWLGAGSELAILSNHDDRIWVLDIARNAAVACMLPANVAQGLLHSSNSIVAYKGHEASDLTALTADVAIWQTIQVPNSYLVNQWPIKLAVISPDGKYIAVAGRRGLAHYSMSSGRWKTYDDPEAESAFAVRGGFCWHQHFLVAAVESGNRYHLRILSREKALERVLHTEELHAPAILVTMSGSDSLLVYTYDNLLLHYILAPSGSSIRLVQVGQIGFHGIIRAPPRVRAISWILPEDQLEHGDPSQDVATASVIFLVDGKLVLLQPSTNEHGELKYDMRVIAQNVEYYILMRDQPATVATLKGPADQEECTNGFAFTAPLGHSLRDSLWYFDGEAYHVWSDVQDVLASAPSELGRDLPPPVRIPMDFCPVSAMVAKGVAHGLDADLVQRRDVNFSFFRLATRTQLFLPQLLRYHLAEYNSPAALHLASSYQHLPYFAHALEVLLHDVLDSEVDSPPSPPETALLPTVISFLSSFPAYLDIIVNCTRKTELRSWQTLFACLPPVLQLFEQALAQGQLKTAAGYLLVLHTFEQDSFQVHEFARLLRRASAEHDWDLCSELARFLVGIDSTGRTLTAALAEAGLRRCPQNAIDAVATNGTARDDTSDDSSALSSADNSTGESNGQTGNEMDYFSINRNG